MNKTIDKEFEEYLDLKNKFNNNYELLSIHLFALMNFYYQRYLELLRNNRTYKGV